MRKNTWIRDTRAGQAPNEGLDMAKERNPGRLGMDGLNGWARTAVRALSPADDCALVKGRFTCCTRVSL